MRFVLRWCTGRCGCTCKGPRRVAVTAGACYADVWRCMWCMRGIAHAPCHASLVAHLVPCLNWPQLLFTGDGAGKVRQYTISDVVQGLGVPSLVVSASSCDAAVRALAVTAETGGSGGGTGTGNSDTKADASPEIRLVAGFGDNSVHVLRWNSAAVTPSDAIQGMPCCYFHHCLL